MVFSSVIFLFCFLPLMLAAYWIAPRRARNGLLLFASLTFYAWGEAFYLGVILASIANLGLLGWFKYANFLVENANHLFTGDSERSNLAARDPGRRAELMQQLRSGSLELHARGAAVYRKVSDKPDPQLQERLRSLGYVE